MEMALIDLISQVGFPIAVSVYAMTSLNKALKENTKAISELKLLIVKSLK